ncbi:MAG: hypothetical protein ACK4HV_02915 [Parachlamydiaceae bacterium]
MCLIPVTVQYVMTECDGPASVWHHVGYADLDSKQVYYADGHHLMLADYIHNDQTDVYDVSERGHIYMARDVSPDDFPQERIQAIHDRLTSMTAFEFLAKVYPRIGDDYMGADRIV